MKFPKRARRRSRGDGLLIRKTRLSKMNMEVDAPNFKGIVKALPQRDDIQFPINEHLIVELYSK